MTESGERTLLVHLCAEWDWRRAQTHGGLRPGPEGFVHLSTPEQVHLPANRLFAGRTDLVALLVDPAALQAPLRWEPGVPGDPEAMVFPHLYGPLRLADVVGVQRYLPAKDGRFAPLIA